MWKGLDETSSDQRQILWSVACTALHVCIWKNKKTDKQRKSTNSYGEMLHSWQVMTYMTNVQRSGTDMPSLCRSQILLRRQILLGEAVQKAGMPIQEWDLAGLPAIAATHTAVPATSITGVQKMFETMQSPGNIFFTYTEVYRGGVPGQSP